jgi:hypothetical protein
MGRPRNFLRRIRAMRRDDGLATLKAEHEILERGPPPGSGVSIENSRLWRQREYFVCPRTKQTCADPDCALGASCKEMQTYGLAGDGRELAHKLRPACGPGTAAASPASSRSSPASADAGSMAVYRPVPRQPRVAGGSRRHNGAVGEAMKPRARHARPVHHPLHASGAAR